MNSSSRQSSQHSRSSEVIISGPQDSDHLIHLVDIPPLPAAYRNRRHQDGPAPNAALRAQRSKDTLNSTQGSCGSNREGHQGTSDGPVSSNGGETPVPQRPQSYVIDFGTPPPIPAAHLHTPVSSINSFERPTPLSPMNALLSGKKQRPALHLDLDSQRAHSSPLSRMVAARGSVNDFSTTLMNEQSRALTPTPSSSTAEWPVMGASLQPSKQPEASNEPKKIFVVKNPNFIFPSIKREPNPLAAPDVTTNGHAEEVDDQASTTTNKSYLHSIRSFMRAHPTPTSIHSPAESDLSQRQQRLRRSISGPSLYTGEHRFSEWSVTESDVYRNASAIRHPLIDHPDLEKGFQRPKEWGEKTPDLIEAELISRQMRATDRLRAEGRGKFQELKGKEDGDKVGCVDGSQNEHVKWLDGHTNMF
ncbi:hypothetical protein EPUS_02267 [Endocarpon pusillum Z07020]|uniref:Uncharacterized protein n=1 Tax=Endocarpon pusillum (strain Z07020 / HMAS-L-300199) TaxID=1263415 RepID=U1GW75_ENDPU|nr:uncharacterized protein EPUS_02267 [Endocarpon pusillum Z07020]ERF76728.1 hypothetical protein EPUS_02267 [Endocarpon pusillum Z07020]